MEQSLHSTREPLQFIYFLTYSYSIAHEIGIISWQEIRIDYHSNLCRDIVDQARRQVEVRRESGGGNGGDESVDV